METRWDERVQHFWFMAQESPFAALLDELCAWADPPAGARVLDAGAGPGGLLARMPAARRTAADLSLAMCRHARSLGLPAVQADATRLPFASASFDRVMASNLFHLVHGRAALAGEVARVLRPDGAALVLVPGPVMSEAALCAYLAPRHGSELAERLSGWGRSAREEGNFDESSLSALLAGAGLGRVETRLRWDGLALLARAQKA